MKIGYIQETNVELNPGQERFRFREAACTRTINSKGDRVRSKMLMVDCIIGEDCDIDEVV